MSIGENIKLARIRKGMTQRQLADKCGISQQALSHIENNAYIPRTNNLHKLCEILDIDDTLIHLKMSGNADEERSTEVMTLNEYQKAAARTISKDLFTSDLKRHALFGICSEVGELHGIYQKIYQGHEPDEKHLMKEVGDILWFVAEFCTAHEWNLNDVAQMNIDKLKARYPDGFDAEHSLHRAKGDV